jgi:hypothetical protein
MMVAVSRQCALEAEDASRHEQPWGSETTTGDKEAYSSLRYLHNSRPVQRSDIIYIHIGHWY